MLWVTGSNDFAYTLNALQPSYRLPKGPRTLCIRLRMPHGHGGAGENPEEIRVFADSILKGGPPLPRITGQGREGNEVWATFDIESAGRPRRELNYTRDIGPWQERKWEAIPARLDGERIGRRACPRGPACFTSICSTIAAAWSAPSTRSARSP